MITIYTKINCTECDVVKNIVINKGLPSCVQFEPISASNMPFIQSLGARSAPVIVREGSLISKSDLITFLDEKQCS